MKLAKAIFISSEEKKALAISQINDLNLNEYEIVFKKRRNIRSIKQNAALHKYCELLSIALNDAGFGMKAVLSEKPNVDIDWTPVSVKEALWKPIQKAITDKESTAEASREDYPTVYEHLNRFTTENYGIGIPFPNKDFKD